MPDWFHVLKHAKDLGQDIIDVRKVLETMVLWEAILQTSEKWPEIREEWHGLMDALRGLADDVV